MRLLGDEVDLRYVSTDAFSFLGDGVYSMLVRERLCCLGNSRSDKLHKASAHLVNAPAQAAAFVKIQHLLDEQELAVYKRGRNAHNNNTPKGSSEGEYHSATGLETLFGFLYLKGEIKRIRELFNFIYND